MPLKIQKAERTQAKLRAAIDGPSGAGKTYTALRLAFSLVPNGKVIVIDSEHGSSQKYQGKSPDGVPWEFDIIELNEDYSPQTYMQAILLAEGNHYDVIIIDSLSHAWESEGGALEIHANLGGRFTDWSKVTPLQNRLISTILKSNAHMICTLRSKTEWIISQDGGRTVVDKVGTAPVQRKDIEYEFDVVVDLDRSHNAVISKTRFESFDKARTINPDPNWFAPLIFELTEGKDVPPKSPEEFFKKVQKELGLSKETATKILKENLYTGYNPEKEFEMYDLLQKFIEAAGDTTA